MSTKLYLFRTRDEDHWAMQIKMAKKFIKPIEKAIREGIEFQKFQTSQGIVFRVLEAGYAMKNKLWDHKWYFPSIVYDSRSMNYNKKWEDFADEIDQLIRDKKYEMITILEERKEKK